MLLFYLFIKKKKSVIILILCFVFQTTFNCIKIGKFHFSILYLLMSMQTCTINIMKRCLNLPQNKLLMAFILYKLQLSALLKTNNCIAIFPVHWRWSFTYLVNMTCSAPFIIGFVLHFHLPDMYLFCFYYFVVWEG